MDPIDVSRRTLLAAPSVLTLATGTAACAQADPAVAGRPSETLVAYFSRSGNTRVIADTLQRLLGAQLFEITASRAYPDDYEATVEQARLERDRSVEPPLAARVAGIAGVRTLFLGFPVWGETAPPVIRSFLRTHDLRGKTLRPFITHGGYGSGESLSVLASHAPGAKIEPPLVLEADQERRTINQVKGWLGRPQPA